MFMKLSMGRGGLEIVMAWGIHYDLFVNLTLNSEHVLL